MPDPSAGAESFEDFRKSIAYGSRNGLNFKFLAGLGDEAASRFIQELLWKLGDCLDDARWGRLVSHVVEGQVAGYSAPGRFT